MGRRIELIVDRFADGERMFGMWHPKTSDGKTPLDLAMRGNWLQVAGLLRARGATRGSQSR